MERKICENPKQLLLERKEMVRHIIRQDKKPKRIPILSQTRAWPIFDAGHTLTETLTNYDLIFDIYCKLQEKYEFDLYMDPGIRFPYKVYQILGASPYTFDDERNSIEFVDAANMYEDEYPELIKNGHKRFNFEKVFPRRFNLTQNEETLKKIAKAVEAHAENGAFAKKMVDHFVNVYGVPGTKTGVLMSNPMENLLFGLRGIEGLSIDMRRHEKELLEAIDVINAGMSDNDCKKLAKEGHKENDAIPIHFTLLAPTLMNAKQFEKFYMPTLRKYINSVIDNDLISIIFTQGSMLHLIDFFRELPKGNFCHNVEKDNIWELRKKLPNLSFAGGMPSYLLGHATVTECLDYTKKMIDEIGYDGKLIVTTDKMLAYPDDAKGENLFAVNNFIREYGVYK